MQVLPIDVTAIIAIILGMSVVLIPVIGATARFALKPTVEALGRFFETRAKDEALHILERRCTLMEQQIEYLEDTVQRISATAEFDRQLSDPTSAGSALPGAGGTRPAP